MRSVYKHGRINPEIQDALLRWLRSIEIDPNEIIDDGSFHVEQVDDNPKQFRVSGYGFIKNSSGKVMGMGDGVAKRHFEFITYSEPRFLTDNLKSKADD